MQTFTVASPERNIKHSYRVIGRGLVNRRQHGRKHQSHKPIKYTPEMRAKLRQARGNRMTKTQLYFINVYKYFGFIYALYILDLYIFIFFYIYINIYNMIIWRRGKYESIFIYKCKNYIYNI